MGLDYEKLGLKVGLEIHQQLKTMTKLFCRCPAELGDEGHYEFVRYLRPTRSELGDVDPAALFEWRKGKYYIYEAPRDHSCLVEADEEPPHPLNREALVIALGVAMALGSTIVDEVYVMRKIVIDGSNTTGFQRTAIVALGGSIRVEGKEIPIETIVLEEDAARKVGEEGRSVRYRLDRLGIPLIEIATAPVISTPEEARKVALAIGRLLRLTGRVRRGLGTIRQDLNVSIEGGAKTEIKGVQRLELIPKVIEYEVMRQLKLLEAKKELERRGAREDEFSYEYVDVTSIFESSKSRIIQRALKRGGIVAAVKLPKMHGLLGMELMPGRRLGTEIADYARFWADIGGLLHSDELPGYGITSEELGSVYRAVGAAKGVDAVVIIADSPGKVEKAVKAIVDRARQVLRGVPEETRAANEDGTTRFLRPRPGSARMYPETDIPPVLVTDEILREASKVKPEPLEAKIEELVKKGVPRDMALEVIDDERLDLIEELLDEYGPKLGYKAIASLFVVQLRGLKSDGIDVDRLSDDQLRDLVRALAEGRITRESVEDIVKYMARKPGSRVDDAVKALGIKGVTREEAERIIEEIVRRNADLIARRGERAMGAIMGEAMKILRGRIDGRTVAEIVRSKIRERLEGAR